MSALVTQRLQTAWWHGIHGPLLLGVRPDVTHSAFLSGGSEVLSIFLPVMQLIP